MTKIKEWLLISDFYLLYPYKKTNVLVTRPYTKQSDQVEHEYQVDYLEYKEILVAYFRVLVNYIKSGGRFKIPSRLGYIYSFKKKYKRSIRYRTGKKKEIFFNFETGGYKGRIRWTRGFKYKPIYNFNFQLRIWRKWGKEVRQNPSLLLNLIEDV